MNKQEEKVRYFIYCRKSSDAEDKQVQSIEEQERELNEFVQRNSLEIVGEPFKESKTAHHPGRSIFNGMMRKIEKGDANGLLVWHANRVSRNPIDSGIVIHLIDEKKLVHVRTPNHTYENTPTGKMMLALEFMMSKKDSDDKSAFVKNGLKTRYIKGFPNGIAKVGYINDPLGVKGDKKWFADHDKLNLVKQLWDRFLTGRYSAASLYEFAQNELGLRTIQRKKEGGKPIARSYIYTLLGDPIYAGFFFIKDEHGNEVRYELNQSIPRVITEEQYWRAQTMLGRKGRPRPSINKHSFAYTGVTKCGSCGGSVTAEHKYQLICSGCRYKFSYPNKTCCPRCQIEIEKMENPTYLHYVYYHCTKRKNHDCPEGSLQEECFNTSLASYFENYLKISPALRDWCIKHVDELVQNDKQNEYERRASLEKTITTKEKEYDALLEMKMKKQIEEDDFLRLKASKKAEIVGLRNNLLASGQADTGAFERARKAFDLAVGIAEIFKNGSLEEKQEAISEIGSNLILKDKNISVYNDNLFSAIINGLLEAKKKNSRFEPAKSEADKDKTKVFASVRPTLLRG